MHDTQVIRLGPLSADAARCTCQSLARDEDEHLHSIE